MKRGCPKKGHPLPYPLKFNFFKGLKYKKRGPLGHAVGASTFAVRAISRVFLMIKIV